MSSTSPCTRRRPRLTWVSEGYEFRRLRVTVKAGEVVDVAMLGHGSLLFWSVRVGFYHATANADRTAPTRPLAERRARGFGVRAPLDFKKGPALGQVATQRTNSELLITFSYSLFPPIRQGFDREKERCEQIQ